MVRFLICIFKELTIDFPNGCMRDVREQGKSRKSKMVFGLSNCKYESSMNLDGKTTSRIDLAGNREGPSAVQVWTRYI